MVRQDPEAASGIAGFRCGSDAWYDEATVQHADLIVVLAEGRIVERGTHATLYAAGGLYRRLHDMQFRT